MSSIARMAVADRIPADPAENAVMHRGLLDMLNDQAERVGWAGVSFDLYTSKDGWAAITVVPGARAATLEDLRAFREQQKLSLVEIGAENDGEPEQRRLV